MYQINFRCMNPLGLRDVDPDHPHRLELESERPNVAAERDVLGPIELGIDGQEFHNVVAS